MMVIIIMTIIKMMLDHGDDVNDWFIHNIEKADLRTVNLS